MPEAKRPLGDLEDSRPPAGLTRRVLRGAGVSGIGFALTQILTLAAFLVLARLATPTEFGQFAAGAILVSLGILFTESGMSSALIHRRDRIESAAATATISTFLAGFGFSLLALALAPVVGTVFDSSTIGEVAAATSGLLLLRTLPLVPAALLQRRFSFIRRVIVEPIGVVVFAIVAIVATAEGMGVWGLVLGYYAQAIADVVLSWWLAHWRPRLGEASVRMWRELIAYARYVFGAAVVIRAANELPTLLIGRYVGTSDLGQFRYANRLATTPLGAMLAIASYVLFPAFARISDDPARFPQAFSRSLRWVALAGVPVGLILIPLGEPLATVIFGEPWREAGQAAAALALFPAAGALGSVMVEAFQAAGRPDLVLRMHGVEAVLGGVAMVLLLPLGLVGVCLGVSFGVLTGVVFAFYRVRGIVDRTWSRLLGEIAAPCLAASIMVGVLLPLDQLVVDAGSRSTGAGLALLAGELALGALVYVGALALLAPARAGELRELVRTLRRRGEEPAEVTDLDEEILEGARDRMG